MEIFLKPNLDISYTFGDVIFWRQHVKGIQNGPLQSAAYSIKYICSYKWEPNDMPYSDQQME